MFIQSTVEDENDERNWDEDTYEIEISCDHEEGEAFVKWLRIHGHEAKIGESTANKVDGGWTSTDREYNVIFDDLWNRYCNS
jgi:hypothetical protein